jgi:hypothetical protein
MANFGPYQGVLRDAIDVTSAGGAPEVLYHYTSLEGAMKIIESNSILASDIRYLNDSLEHQFAWTHIQSIAERHSRGALHELTREVLHHVSRLPGRHLSFSGGAFVCCFSDQSDLLSQWRAYGDDGHGVALGFSTSAGFAPVSRTENRLSFRRVIYELKDQISMLEPHVRGIIEIADASAHQGDESIRDSATTALLTLAVFLGTTIKNPAFSEEHEWRNYLGAMAPLGLTKVRKGRSGLVPYCELGPHGAASPPSLPLKDIVVGPRFDGPQVEAFITYLATQGYEVAIPGLLVREDLPEGTRQIGLQRSKASYR